MTPIERLSEIVSGEDYKGIAEAITSMRTDFIDDNLIFVHIKALSEIMPRLSDIVAKNMQRKQQADEAAKSLKQTPDMVQEATNE